MDRKEIKQRLFYLCNSVLNPGWDKDPQKIAEIQNLREIYEQLSQKPIKNKESNKIKIIITEPDGIRYLYNSSKEAEEIYGFSRYTIPNCLNKGVLSRGKFKGWSFEEVIEE